MSFWLHTIASSDPRSAMQQVYDAIEEADLVPTIHFSTYFDPVLGRPVCVYLLEFKR